MLISNIETLIGCVFALATFYITGKLFFARAYSPAVVFLGGVCATGVVAQFLLMVDLFTSAWMFFFAGIVWILFFIRNAPGWRSNPPRLTRGMPKLHIHEWGMLGTVTFALTLYTVLNFVPLSAPDGFAYHLPFVRDFLIFHHINQPIAGITTMNAGYYPAFGEILYATSATLTGLSSLGPGTIAVHVGIFVAFMLALYSESRFLIASRSIRGIVLLLLMVFPHFRDTVVLVGMIDLICNSFLIIGSLLLLRGLWKGEEGSRDVWAGAFFLGCSLAVKYTAFIVAGYWGLFILFLLCTRAAPRLPTLLWGIVLGLLAPLYWYLKNTLNFHNPIYPLFTGAGPETQIDINNFLPHTWWVHILYPIFAFLPFFFRSVTGYTIFVESIVAMFTLLGVALLFILERRIERSVVALLSFWFFYSYLTSAIADDIRYNLPSLIMFTILAGILIERLLRYLPTWSPRVLGWSVTVIYLALTPLMLSTYGPRIDLLLGRITNKEYIISQTLSHSVEDYDLLVKIKQDAR
jgi:hypothetical protein